MKNWLAVASLLFAGTVFQAFAVAQTQTPSSPDILLVYWSANDCRWCSYWESSMSGMENSLKSSDEFKKLTYRVIKSERLADTYTDEHFSPDMKWLKERIDRGEEKRPGRPGWVFYVKQVRLATFYGTRDWYEKSLPEIKRLVSMHSKDRQ